MIYKANIIYTKDRSRFEVLENGYIAVDTDGTIIGVSRDLASLTAAKTPQKCTGPAADMEATPQKCTGPAADMEATPQSTEVIDFGNCLLIPAMNDMHVHASQYRNQGLAMDLELMQWLQNYTYPEETKYANMAYAERMYRRFIHDLWRHGTMRSCVFATSHIESTRLLMQYFYEAGMGGYVGLVAMDRDCPDQLAKSVEVTMSGYEELISECNRLKANGIQPLIEPIITPRFIPSCTPEMLRACGQMAAKYQIPVQSHLSENREEIATVESREGTWYGNAYNRYGLFGQTPTVMAHCVFSDDKETALMKRNGVMVAHCPTSNINVSTGSFAPVRKFIDNGLHVGLGSDISGGHDLSIFRTMVYAIQESKCVAQFTGVRPLTLSEVFWIATKSGGSFFSKVGSFEPGYEFDALVIDDSDLNYGNYTLTERLERYIYIGDDRQIVHRFCRGHEIPEPREW